MLGDALLSQGRTDEAVENLKKAVDLSGRGGRELASLGYALAVQGNRSEAGEIAKELEALYAKRETTAMALAAVYTGLGEKDKAFEWLEKCFQAGDTRLVEIRWHFSFQSLRSDPRYADLVKRMGLPASGLRTED